MLAYLVIREGAQWTDVFRLIPGQSVTIGRAPTNQIVVKDERCSRCHAELFYSEGRWTLRDLDSRNGTAIGGVMIRDDYVLQPNDIVRIGRTQLVFVHELSKAFSESGAPLPPELAAEAAEAANSPSPSPDLPGDDSSVLTAHEPTTITHRKNQSRFLESATEAESAGAKAATKLCRLAYEIAQVRDPAQLPNVALAGLFEGTQVDSGGVLLVPRGFEGHPTSADLELVASRADSEFPYHRVSPFLASTVLREGEAVLARNVMGDSNIAVRDSKGEIHATSVICAPVRLGKKMLGLIHLYSTDAGRVLDPDDLEFTLAVADTLAVAWQNVRGAQELAENLHAVRGEIRQLRQQLGVQSELVGSSSVVQRITDEIARAAQSRATVLIRGESGVGKELVARAVHFSSPRRNNVFVCVNCAALSETLLESELFGHERGAFTGATERKIGKFEQAHEGTLMLDEIGEMSPQVQAKFLRVLEGHPFERVGGSQPVKVDVRVIAATNRDLEKDVAENVFRRDLYFRLRVLEIYVPPLRKRIEDISDLAHYFLKKYNEETGRKIRGFSPTAMQQMLKYRWPGNVREMKNVVERAIVLARADFIDEHDLMLSKLATAGDTGDLAPPGDAPFEPLSLEEVERRHILATLLSTNWNKSQAAQLLGIERSTLDRKIRRYELGREGVGNRD